MVVLAPTETCRNVARLYKCKGMGQLADSNLIDAAGTSNTVKLHYGHYIVTSDECTVLIGSTTADRGTCSENGDKLLCEVFVRVHIVHCDVYRLTILTLVFNL